MEIDLEEQFSKYKKQLLEHIQAICDQKVIEAEEEIIQRREDLAKATDWVAIVDELLETTNKQLAQYEDYFNTTMNGNQQANNVNLDMNFFEENARNQEKLSSLDKATG